ncbi:hypothetical protein AAFF_G00391190 [Aldrovandia affinis]|uniref:Uncharacterized protein n=1 Tax=Aldrovandia affinis TaxID=143900 RepID=A0AAD7SE16_9TELE|nr:hypothetical protein AAFF_G00391190 [Aldrovandia affinis]
MLCGPRTPCAAPTLLRSLSQSGLDTTLPAPPPTPCLCAPVITQSPSATCCSRALPSPLPPPTGPAPPTPAHPKLRSARARSTPQKLWTPTSLMWTTETPQTSTTTVMCTAASKQRTRPNCTSFSRRPLPANDAEQVTSSSKTSSVNPHAAYQLPPTIFPPLSPSFHPENIPLVCS